MKVLIADRFEQNGIDGITAAGCEVIYQPEAADQQLANILASTNADVLVVRSTQVTGPMLAGIPLSLIVRAGAGVNTIDVAEASRRGIYVSNCPGQNSIAVAELTFGLILALDRRIVDCTLDLRNGTWNKKGYSQAKGLFGRTLGIIGFGSVGQAVADRARAFGMPVVVWSRRFIGNPESLAVNPDGITVAHSAEEVAERADILSVHLALTHQTRNFVGAAIVNRLKPGSYFVNTSRGEIVDHAALADAVRARNIRVALDVFANEPAGSTGDFSDPLVGLRNVIGTHHIGASTEQAQEAIAAEAVRIIRAYKETGKVPNVVNLATHTPATQMLVVRHRDRPGVLAHVFGCLRAADLNVQEMENIVFDGAEAAIARINLDGSPSVELLQTITQGNQDILSLYVVRI